MSRLKMLQIIHKPLRPLKASANFSINYTFETPNTASESLEAHNSRLSTARANNVPTRGFQLVRSYLGFALGWATKRFNLDAKYEVRRLFRTNWAVSLTHTQSIRSVQAGWWWGRWRRLGNSIRVIIRSITSSSRSLSLRSRKSGKQLLPFSTVKCEL